MRSAFLGSIFCILFSCSTAPVAGRFPASSGSDCLVGMEQLFARWNPYSRELLIERNLANPSSFARLEQSEVIASELLEMGPREREDSLLALAVIARDYPDMGDRQLISRFRLLRSDCTL